MTRDPLEKLRKTLKNQVKEEGLRPFSERSEIPVGQVRGLLSGHRITVETAARVARELGFEFSVCPKKEGVGTEVVQTVSTQSALLAELIELFLSVEGLERKRILVEACGVFVREDEDKKLNQKA